MPSEPHDRSSSLLTLEASNPSPREESSRAVLRRAFALVQTSRPLAKRRRYLITVPGVEVKSDWVIVHDRLLDDFPKVEDVLPTTTPATLLIVYRGRAQIDAWLDALSAEILHRRATGPRTAKSYSPSPPIHQFERQKGSSA